jgi:hypothetical protein
MSCPVGAKTLTIATFWIGDSALMMTSCHTALSVWRAGDAAGPGIGAGDHCGGASGAARCERRCRTGALSVSL